MITIGVDHGNGYGPGRDGRGLLCVCDKCAAVRLGVARAARLKAAFTQPREPWQEVVCEFTRSGICAANCAEACICARAVLPMTPARGSTLEERLDDQDVWP